MHLALQTDRNIRDCNELRVGRFSPVSSLIYQTDICQLKYGKILQNQDKTKRTVHVMGKTKSQDGRQEKATGNSQNRSLETALTGWEALRDFFLNFTALLGLFGQPSQYKVEVKSITTGGKKTKNKTFSHWHRVHRTFPPRRGTDK